MHNILYEVLGRGGKVLNQSSKYLHMVDSVLLQRKKKDRRAKKVVRTTYEDHFSDTVISREVILNLRTNRKTTE